MPTTAPMPTWTYSFIKLFLCRRPSDKNLTLSERSHLHQTARENWKHDEMQEVAAWADLQIPDADFDVACLHAAIDAKRTERGLSWTAVALEVNRSAERQGAGPPISPSTISGLKNKRWGVEGDGVLQMLLWLGRSPETFVTGHPGAAHPDAQLPRLSG